MNSSAPPVRPDRHPAIRHDLVARVRRDIAAGTYETPAKLDAAVDRMAVELV